MNHHGRSRRDHYREESQQDHYPSAGYGAQRLPYPDAAAQLYQQNPMLAQVSRAHGNGMPQYAEEDVRFHGFNNVAQQVYYKQQRGQETTDDERYAESRTTNSGTRTSTERTRSTPEHTSSSRSTSRYTSFSSSSSESTWEDGGIFSALNDMAGNLKKIGGMNCNNKVGPETAEVQMKLNLPLPIVQEGFNNAMLTLSPKKCGNMQYDYQHLDEHVIGMEERFLGTMDQIQGNVMPVYKSLFQSQSESSSSDDDIYEDDDQSESTYEDPRYISKVAPKIQQPQFETTNVVETPIMTQNVNGIPTQIIVSNQPSCVSSSDSWKILSPRDESQEYANKFAAKNNIIKTISNNLDTAHRGSKHQSDESESNRRNEVQNRETAEIEKKTKSKPRNVNSNTEIPQVIKVKNEENVHECYSDLTSGVPMSAQASAEKEKSTSNVPAIKTQFSRDETMDYNKASFQRNSTKKGTAGLNDLTDKEVVFVKSDPPTTKSASSRPQAFKNKRRGKSKVEEDDCNDDKELELMIQLREEREKAKKKLDEERKRFEDKERKRFEAEAKAKAMQEALEAEKLEERVQAELKAAREAVKLEKERKQREAEEHAAEEALVAKRLEEERKQHEARAKAVEEALIAKRLEEERKRVEAVAKATQEALEEKRLEGERKRREAEAKAAQEARKMKKLEEQRKIIEAETKAAAQVLEALYAKKADEERRQREAEAKKVEERKEREAKAEAKLRALEAKKLKEARKRVEAETKAAEEEYEELEEERKRIVTETRAVEKALNARKSGKERKRTEVKTKPDLYKVQRFEDYCQSVAGTVDDIGEAPRTNNDMYDDDDDTSSVEERSASSIQESDGDSEEDQESLPSHEEEYSTGTMSLDEQSNSTNSVDTCSSDEESDIYTDATSFVEDSDSKMATSVSDIRSNNTTKRLRNRVDAQPENSEIKYPFSSEESVNTMDRTVQSSFSKSKYPMKKSSKLSSAYTSDVPIPIAATMSTMPTMPTFDQGTVHSGQHSLGRFLKSSDESVLSSVGYSHHSITSAKPVALSVTALPRDTKKKNEIKSDSRSSILGSIVSFTLSLVLRVLFTIILFSYTWIKHLVIMIGKKQVPKVDCTPFELQPDQAIRREEIQDRSTDDLIHQNAIQQHRTPYLGYEDPNHHQEHYTTTMIMKPRGYLGDDSDEVGTCVESIVPDAHYPNMSDGKISAWKITQKNTETSSLSSPPSTSFRVLKSAYSALSSKRESEKSNWMDQPTIDDEMSYYE